jgi:plastocyanin
VRAQGCDRRFYTGPVYHQPAPIVYYSYMPYYAPPVYYPLRQYHPSSMSPQPSRGPTTTISIGASDDYFQPGTVNVQPGTTVKWVNKGRHKHTVTSDTGVWDSGDLAPGATYSVTFSKPGTYYYHCRHHKGMKGTIVVDSGGSSGR